MPEGVRGLVLREQAAVLARGALGDDDDRERRARSRGGAGGASHTSSMSNGRSGIRITSAPPAMPGVDGEPAGVAAHDLDDDHAVVGLGRGVQPVDRVRRDLHRGLEAEREVRGARSLSIVFGTPTTGMPSSCSLPGDAERVLAADRDQGVEALGLHRRLDLVQAVLDLVDVGAGRSEDRPAAVQDPARGGEVERHRVVVQDAGPAVAEARRIHGPWASMPFRTMARMTALSPGQSPPPVSTPIRIGARC